jgi:mono/diheme cytochrome c family protein/rhodanese-related sulfurtransferase
MGRRALAHLALVISIAIAGAAGCRSKSSSGVTADLDAGVARPDGGRPLPPTRDALIEQGATDYVKYCALCHGPDAKGYAADHAPSLVSETFLATANDYYLARSIREGRPGTAMAPYAQARGGPLTEQDVNALVAFFRANGPNVILPPPVTTPGDAKRGQDLFESTCTKCHGTKDEHGDAPQLSNSVFLSAATDGFLRYAIMNGRPGTPMPAFKDSLDDGKVADVIALLRSWAPAPPPPPQRPAPIDVPFLPPYVINPSGRPPHFTVKEDRYVPADEVKKALDEKDRLVILDARPTSEWLLAHIPGALTMPYYALANIEKLPKDGTWILAYCACPHHASGVVVDELRRKGFSHSAVIDEGILEWQKRKYPVVAATGSAAASASAAALAIPPRRKP